MIIFCTPMVSPLMLWLSLVWVSTFYKVYCLLYVCTTITFALKFISGRKFDCKEIVNFTHCAMSIPLLICTWFLKNQVGTIKFEELDFQHAKISKLIFAGNTGSKNPVRNRLKLQFIELDFSKLFFKNQVQINRGICKKFEKKP